MKEHLPFAAFMASAALLATGYGVVAERYKLFPAPQIMGGIETGQELAANWRNDFGIEPTRHLVEARRTGRAGPDDARVDHQAGGGAPGMVLVAGLDVDQDRAHHAVTLLDEEGVPVHVWPVRYERLVPDGVRPQNTMLHGMEVFADGSLVVAFDGGDALARIDACGEPMWVRRGAYHHSVAKGEDGALWTWRELAMEKIDPETGETLHSLDLMTQVAAAGDPVHGQHGVFSIRAYAEREGRVYDNDPLHPNDVEPLSSAMAAAFPMFEAGDLLISLREINLVAVIDPEDGILRWAKHGPWHKQHDPDFQADGTITLFDNATGSGASRILRVDPATNAVSTVYQGDEASPFYSFQRGKHQMLPGGGVLVAEAEHGRIFETAADGSLVWEQEAMWDADRNVIVTEARKIPHEFFAAGLPSCATND